MADKPDTLISDSFIQRAHLEYQKYLYLYKVRSPKEKGDWLVPSIYLDAMWHAHVRWLESLD